MECTGENASRKSRASLLFFLFLFGVAMACFEAAIVVYLRELYYPDGFDFPLKLIESHILLVEIGREAASIVMLLAVALIAGKSFYERFAFFAIIFAVWDIFYYIWLKVLLDWPASIMDWDILFLIPVTWASPVLYPVLISITLIGFAVVILYRCSCGRSIRATLPDWLGFSAAGLIVVVSFCLPGLHITEQDFASYFYRPLFAAGYLFGLVIFLKCLLKSK